MNLFLRISGTAIVILLLLCSCDRKPTEPTDVVRDYRMYAMDRHVEGVVYGYSPLTNELDTLHVPADAGGPFAVSRNGLWLYMNSDMGVIRVNASDGTVKDTFLLSGPYVKAVYSPDGRYLAFCGSASGFTIVRSDDHSCVLRNCPGGSYGSFSPDGDRFYTASDTLVRVYDVADKNPWPVHMRTFNLGIRWVAVADDEEVWYMAQHNYICAGYVTIWKETTNDLIYRQIVPYWVGDINMTSDRDYLFWVDGRPLITYCSGENRNMVFRFSTRDSKIDTFMVGGMFPQEYPYGLGPEEIEITPDGRWLVVVDQSSRGLVTIDLRTREAVHFCRLPEGNEIHGWVCQS